MVKPEDFQALQMLTIAISQHLAQTSPEYRRLIAEISGHLAKGIAVPQLIPELADHHSGQLQDAWVWLTKRAMPQ